MKVVLDTNVLLAAFTFEGQCLTVVETCLESHTVLLSEHILGELLGHLTGKFGVSDDRAAAVESLLRRECQWVVPSEVDEDACRDPDDLPVLGTLLAADADCLVTGDRDLLDLETVPGDHHPLLLSTGQRRRLRRLWHRRRRLPAARRSRSTARSVAADWPTSPRRGTVRQR